MTKLMKSVFIDLVDEWEKYWRDSIEFYEFLDDYVELSDDQRTYVIKKKKHKEGLE